jgi:two-component system, sensor histidine kinase and response regulator
MKYLGPKPESPQKFRFLKPVAAANQVPGLDNLSRSFSSIRSAVKRKTKRWTVAFLRRYDRIIDNISISLSKFQARVVKFHYYVCSFGVTDSMELAVRRRLSLLNQINILHFITCLIIPFMALFNNKGISLISLLLSLAPVGVSALVLMLNYMKRYNNALLSYFILYPFFTCLIYLDGMNLGMELYFIMYGILAVFFLKEISHMLFSVAFSMISYFMLAVVIKNYSFQLETASPGFYFFNQVVAIVFIFYGLFLIMKENAGYQGYILQKNKELEEMNVQIEKKKQIISDKAQQLEQQTIQLTALNSFKTKLFSIISHDLRSPVYALRDLFNNAADGKITAEEVQELIPDAASDLSYTAGLMENLLQWAKSQMQSSDTKPQALDLSQMIREVIQLLRLQANAKKVYLESKIKRPVYVYADKDMLNLVIRNLMSNAIKFTGEEGKVMVDANERDSFVEVFVKDTGTGMSTETLAKLNENNFFTTKGTANESGTGLGLMLCKEFLAKNGGRMHVESTEGQGSTFSFTLPIGD